MQIVKRLAVIGTLGVLAAMFGCHSGGDDPPAPPPPPPAPVVTIAANPAAVQLGSAATITWSSTNSTSCAATGAWTGVKATSGTESATPQAAGDASYSLACTGSGGTASAATTVAVSAPPAAPTATVTPAASTVVVGSSTTLTWSSSNATGCTASGAWSGAKSASGNETVTLAALGAANYTLTCTGAGGSIVASATVTAIAAVDFLLTANENGNVSVYKLDAATGAPSDIGGSPFLAGGAPRTIVFGADNRFAYIGNQSTTDISVYRVDQVTGALTPITGSPFAIGGGPQAMAIHPAGTFLYVAAGDGLYTNAVNPTSGALTSVGTAVPGNHGVALHPSGNFAYAVSAGVAGVYVYAIGGNGALTAIAGSPFAGGTGGVEVAIDPTGQFAYVARTVFDSPGTVSAYSIDATTGALTPVGSPLATATGPTMLAIDPQGAFLYLACNGGPTHFGALAGYSINRSTGALTPLPGSPFSPSDHYSMAFAINRSGTYAYETRFRAGSTQELRTLSIGTTGALTEVPGSRLSIGHAWTNGIALTR